MNPAAGDRFRCGRGLLRHLLGLRLGVAPTDLVFLTEAGGRPYLECTPGNRPAIFSLSHSHDIISIAISSSGPLGIDVECLRPGTDKDAIVRRFFKPVEREAWDRLPAGAREAAFLRLWTRKEAVLKALGLGLTGLDRLSVSLEESLDRPVVWLADDPGASERWWCSSWSPASGYLTTLASIGNPAELSIRTWDSTLADP